MMKSKLSTLLLLFILTTNAYSQKLGTLKNPVVLKFPEYAEMPVLIENRFELTDTIMTSSGLAMAIEYLINTSACVLESIAKKDTNIITEGREYLKLADSLFREFQSQNIDYCSNKNINMVMYYAINKLKGIYEKSDNFTFPMGNIRYYKINNKIFKVDFDTGYYVLAELVSIQGNMFKILRIEMHRLHDKK